MKYTSTQEKVDKPLFLDVDGVLNSYRNVIAQGGFPFPAGGPADKDPKHREKNLDPLAVGMVRKLCKEFDAKIVLHSTWRAHLDPIEFGKRWDLPIVDGTNPNISKPASIKAWLADHPEVSGFLVIDDDDMGVGNRQITTNIFEGFLYADYIRCQKKLAMPHGMGPGAEK